MNTPSNSKSLSRHIIPVVAIVMVAFFLTLPTLRYGYLLEEYMYLRAYDLEEIARTFYGHWEPTLVETKGYRPFHSVHYALFHFLIGGTPLANHILKNVLYLAGGLLFYLFIYLTVNKRSPALWSAIIYLCLGTNGWQASWLSCRPHLLQVILLFLCLISFHRYLQSKSITAWCVCFISFLFALLTKELAITFPLILLAFAMIVGNKSPFSQIKPLLPFFIVLGIFLLVRAAVVRQLPQDNIHPPPIDYSLDQLSYEYAQAFFSTLSQSQGIRDPNNDFPIYAAGIITPRDYIALFSVMFFLGTAGLIVVLTADRQLKRLWLFGLIFLLINNIMTAAWYRNNLLYISSAGTAIILGVCVSTVFNYLQGAPSIRKYSLGLFALFFFAISLLINIGVFFEYQWALRPKGFLSLTWDRWAYEEYLPWMREEQMLIFRDKLRRTGRAEWANRLPLSGEPGGNNQNP